MDKKYGMALALAAVGFCWTFSTLAEHYFWIKITVTTCTLCAASFAFAGVPWHWTEVTLREIFIGIAAAVLLYGIFWCGDFMSAKVFGFAPKQVEAIYAIRELGNPWLIGTVLFLVTSPGEELFWRGYVMKRASDLWGQPRGFAAGALFYSAAHLVTGNFMLVMAALVAGIFWCALYRWRGNLTACMVSHALWTIGVFLLFPIR